MGKLLPKFRACFAEDVITSITANAVHYYAFAAGPVENVGNPPTETLDTEASLLDNIHSIIFGKKISNTDVIPVADNIVWTTNTIYDRYDNTVDLSNSEYYVVTDPSEPGAPYHVFKCIDNANGEPSTEKPDQVQAASFSKSDGYTWRYLYSVSSANYTKFGTTDYIPLYSNSTIVSGSYSYMGVEVVPIVNAGAGYDSYHDGIVRAKPNTTLLQIENEASGIANFYQNNAIYLTNNNDPSAQLLTISSYVSNSSGNWITLTESANLTAITPGITNYKISPRVLFETDGDETPKAYTIISETSNAIANVVIIDTGYGITRANASIVTSIVSPVSREANVYCIVPPPGGHGSHPEAELKAKGMSVSISFSGTESNTIPTNISYNTIGLLKKPYILEANGSQGAAFSNSTFNALLRANVAGQTYLVGDVVTGSTSNAKGTVAFANSSVLYLTGDKHFEDGETILDENSNDATITIVDIGDIYIKNLTPIYYRNIVDVSRANTQAESFKLIIQVA